MKTLIWNMEYWKNYGKHGWIEKCKDTLTRIIKEKEIDFILLQETNPFKLFNLNYESKEPYQYENIKYDNSVFFFHELYSELPMRFRKNLWGNAIIVNTKIKNYNCNIDYNDNNHYYGRNGLMCYTFELEKDKVTFVNFYNKSNIGIYTMLDKNHFAIENDIRNIIEKNNNLVVFAGDFNTGSNNDDELHRNRYTDLCNKLDKFVDISNGDPKHNQNTTFWYNFWKRKGFFLRNDFCFINDTKLVKRHSVEFPENDKWEGDKDKKWNGLSDHCPIIVDLTL